MTESRLHAGTKRSYGLDEAQPTKRRRVHHRLQHTQPRPDHIEPAPQDEIFAQGQLLRSITTALTIAGFDSVKATALESFKQATEEYMLKLGSYVRTSMQAQRRTRPTAKDFEVALALTPATSTASLLKPQLRLPIPQNVSYPSIPEPDPPPEPAPDFRALLDPLMPSRDLNYIPRHFPALPSKHTWMQTADLPAREKDARKMREKATQEGMLAEQALRKLATAAKAGALKAEHKRKSSALSGPGKARAMGEQKRLLADEYDAFADAMKDVGVDAEGDIGMGMDGVHDAADGIDTGMPDGVVVNHDMNYWRHGGTRQAMR